MNGIELSENFFSAVGKPMLEEKFSGYLDKIAVGIVGNGSECYGYDDDLSRDHDFSAGFCLWINEETDREIGFSLMREYNKLPKTFENISLKVKNTYGGERFGVSKISDFYRRLTGFESTPKSAKEWLYMPEFAVCNATNGKIFMDKGGEFTKIRNDLKCGAPEDMWLKKISARLALMAQSGQYNYFRMIKRGETAGAQLALNEFVTHAFYLIFAMNREYTPYYKWRFRKLKEQKILGGYGYQLERLISSGNDEDNVKIKKEIIEKLCADIVTELKNQNLTASNEEYLEPQAFLVQAKIEDRYLSKLHIMETGE